MLPQPSPLEASLASHKQHEEANVVLVQSFKLALLSKVLWRNGGIFVAKRLMHSLAEHWHPAAVVQSRMDFGQFLTPRAASCKRQRNYATMPQSFFIEYIKKNKKHPLWHEVSHALRSSDRELRSSDRELWDSAAPCKIAIMLGMHM